MALNRPWGKDPELMDLAPVFGNGFCCHDYMDIACNGINVSAFILVTMLGGTPAGDEQGFSGVLEGMNPLMVHSVFAEQSEMIAALLQVGLSEYIVFVFYLVIGSLTVLDMLIGVILRCSR